MSNTLTLVLLVLVLVALAFLVRQSAILATRLDRLHWRILTTRDSLALLLDERARYSERIADYPGFTSDESQDIREASTRARRQMIPLVADGLDRRTSEASIRDTQTREKVIEFFDIQSQLSRILRSALNVKLRKEIDADDYWSRELRELDQASTLRRPIRFVREAGCGLRILRDMRQWLRQLILMTTRLKMDTAIK